MVDTDVLGTPVELVITGLLDADALGTPVELQLIGLLEEDILGTPVTVDMSGLQPFIPGGGDSVLELSISVNKGLTARQSTITNFGPFDIFI